ncbi:MAG: hypothetical protein HQL21_09795, partial [Candidatus Omnitrophica bacterium]|nr:hypothetical protein [Candidatus Omnitrophota bacterium]
EEGLDHVEILRGQPVQNLPQGSLQFGNFNSTFIISNAGEKKAGDGSTDQLENAMAQQKINRVEKNKDGSLALTTGDGRKFTARLISDKEEATKVIREWQDQTREERKDLKLLDESRWNLVLMEKNHFVVETRDAAGVLTGLVGAHTAGMFKYGEQHYVLATVEVTELFRGLGLSKAMTIKALEQILSNVQKAIDKIDEYEIARGNFGDIPVGDIALFPINYISIGASEKLGFRPSVVIALDEEDYRTREPTEEEESQKEPWYSLSLKDARDTVDAYYFFMKPFDTTPRNYTQGLLPGLEDMAERAMATAATFVPELTKKQSTLVRMPSGKKILLTLRVRRFTEGDKAPTAVSIDAFDASNNEPVGRIDFSFETVFKKSVAVLDHALSLGTKVAAEEATKLSVPLLPTTSRLDEWREKNGPAYGLWVKDEYRNPSQRGEIGKKGEDNIGALLLTAGLGAARVLGASEMKVHHVSGAGSFYDYFGADEVRPHEIDSEDETPTYKLFNLNNFSKESRYKVLTDAQGNVQGYEAPAGDGERAMDAAVLKQTVVQLLAMLQPQNRKRLLDFKDDPGPEDRPATEEDLVGWLEPYAVSFTSQESLSAFLKKSLIKMMKDEFASPFALDEVEAAGIAQGFRDMIPRLEALPPGAEPLPVVISSFGVGMEKKDLIETASIALKELSGYRDKVRIVLWGG